MDNLVFVRLLNKDELIHLQSPRTVPILKAELIFQNYFEKLNYNVSFGRTPVLIFTSFIVHKQYVMSELTGKECLC